jgi:hypothetical protein
VFCVVRIHLLFTHRCTHYDLLYPARLFVVTTAVVVVVRTEAGVGGHKRSDGDVTTSLAVAVLALAVKGTSAVCG